MTDDESQQKRFKVNRPAVLGGVVLFVLALAACDDGGEDRAQVVERAASLSPQNAQLAEKYQRSCKTCHGKPDTGAPLTGDALAWKPRLEKGQAVLFKSSVNGFQGMPPLGLCSDCSADDITNLILFMSSTSGEPGS